MKALFFSMALMAGLMLFGSDMKGNSDHLFEAGRVVAAQISTIIR